MNTPAPGNTAAGHSAEGRGSAAPLSITEAWTPSTPAQQSAISDVPAVEARIPVDAFALPPLREDLRLFPAAPNGDGSPAWVIQDPVSNRFFRVGWTEFELLFRWGLQDPSAILAATRSETPLDPEPEDLRNLIIFLCHNQLVRVSESKESGRLLAMARARHTSPWRWLLHNYLFFRLPLVRPQAFLHATAPWVAFAFSPGFLALTVLATALGLGLAARQWDLFLSSLVETFSLEGFVSFAVALAFAKMLHEFGHAYTAQRLDVRVAHMGIAFLVLWPVLYTDTSESWRLARRGDRLRIAAAGLVTELALAGWATLGWAVAPDGAVRGALFFLATSSWVVSLTINASPFMRFDGYYLLSDALDLPNLHERAGAFARAWLRRWLLGWTEPDPEPLGARLGNFLTLFAFATWTYRLIVFVAIALAVYYFFFKALGIILFAVEIGWFVLRPVVAELKIWHGGWERTPIRRRLLLWSLALFALAALLLPWHRNVHAVAWLHAAQWQVVYSPLPARLVDLADGPVAAGAAIAVLDSPDARSRARQAGALADAYAVQWRQAVGHDLGLERQSVFAEQVAEQLAQVAAERAELKRLELRAPFAGRMADRDPYLAPGSWVAPQQQLAVLVADTDWIVAAYVEQQDLERVAPGDLARFYPRRGEWRALTGRVTSVDTARTTTLPHPALAAPHGGPVATLAPKHPLAPSQYLYRVQIALDTPPGERQELTGQVVIAGHPQAPLLSWGRAILAVLIRESGF